jgi:hypothetical protein
MSRSTLLILNTPFRRYLERLRGCRVLFRQLTASEKITLETATMLEWLALSFDFHLVGI